MEILNITVHSTLVQELVLCLIALLMLPFLTFMMITTPEKKLKKNSKIIAIIINAALIVTMWIACLSRVHEYELIEVKVIDWNEIINSDEFELVEYKGNIATLTRVIKED